jgi:hypothetical protein
MESLALPKKLIDQAVLLISTSAITSYLFVLILAALRLRNPSPTFQNQSLLFATAIRTGKSLIALIILSLRMS